MKTLLLLLLLAACPLVAVSAPTQLKSQSKPQLKSQSKPQLKSQSKPRSKPRSKPQPQPQSQSQSKPQPQPQNGRTATYVSDTVDIPLRAGASDRHKIIGAVRSGSAIQALKVDSAKGYTQIRTPSGARGWLRSDQLTDTPSSREQLAGTRQELEQLQARHGDLQQHMDDVADKPGGEGLSYPQLYEEAQKLRQQLAQYRKVSADTVAIDDRNKDLQERVVTLERELQIVQQESRALRNENNNIRLLMGGVLLGACLLIAVLVPKIRERRRAQWNQL